MLLTEKIRLYSTKKLASTLQSILNVVNVGLPLQLAYIANIKFALKYCLLLPLLTYDAISIEIYL